MEPEGCTPVDIPSLLAIRDYDFVVRCLELIRRHAQEIDPRSRQWRIKVIALCHHHPVNVYPAFGIFDPAESSIEVIDDFGRLADDWIRSKTLGWLIDAGTQVPTISWEDIRRKTPLG